MYLIMFADVIIMCNQLWFDCDKTTQKKMKQQWMLFYHTNECSFYLKVQN